MPLRVFMAWTLSSGYWLQLSHFVTYLDILVWMSGSLNSLFATLDLLLSYEDGRTLFWVTVNFIDIITVIVFETSFF